MRAMAAPHRWAGFHQQASMRKFYSCSVVESPLWLRSGFEKAMHKERQR